MTFDHATTSYQLSTGRVLTPNMGIFGISPAHPRDLYGGYDDIFFEATADVDLGDGDDPLTLAERAEIAEFMIARWREWAAARRD